MSGYIYKKNKLTDTRYENINKETVNKNSGFTFKKDDLTDTRYENINKETVNKNSGFTFKKDDLTDTRYENINKETVNKNSGFTFKKDDLTDTRYENINKETVNKNSGFTFKKDDLTDTKTVNKHTKTNSNRTKANFNDTNTQNNKNEEKNTHSNYKEDDNKFSHKVQNYKIDIYSKKGFASMEDYLNSLDINKRKGIEYELYVGKEFANQGYKIYPNGLINNLEDGGIDILAWKKNSVAIIQCKNWSSPPKQEELRKFYGDACHWIQSNKIKIKNRKVIYFFITSCPIIDKGVKHYLEKNKDITYEIIT